jgi:hypothetical protein
MNQRTLGDWRFSSPNGTLNWPMVTDKSGGMLAGFEPRWRIVASAR